MVSAGRAVVESGARGLARDTGRAHLDAVLLRWMSRVPSLLQTKQAALQLLSWMVATGSPLRLGSPPRMEVHGSDRLPRGGPQTE